MQERSALYIDGAWEPSSAPTIDVVNPSTEEVIGVVPAAGPAEADRAVRAARRVQEEWGCTPPETRARLLGRVRDALVARGDEIARTITAEVGMPLKLSRRIQAGLPAAVVESYVALLADHAFEERIGNSVVVREPAGVAVCITPWNYPLHQAVAKVAPALAAGCTVVLKPSEVAPLTAFILAEVIHEAGFPAGVFNLVTGYGENVGEALASHPEADLVSFTGSVRGGKRVAAIAAAAVKRVTLELGGKSAALVLDDADLAAAVKGTVGACFLNSGQTCTAHSRLLVPEQLYEQTVSLAVEAAVAYRPGDPEEEKTRLGPLVSAVQRERVLRYIQGGIAEGAELLLGGTEPPEGLSRGFFVRPTLFGRVTPTMTIAREEIFGPVLSIMTYRDEEEGIAIANGTPYGLAAGVWSGDPARAMRIARRLRAGQVDINGAPFNLLAPFGGCKESGYGRELGKYGLDEFLTTKAIQLRE